MAIQYTHGKLGSNKTFSTSHSDASEACRDAVRFSRSILIGPNRATGTPPLRALEDHWQQLYGIGQMENSEELRAYRECVHRMCNALHGACTLAKLQRRLKHKFSLGRRYGTPYDNSVGWYP